MKLLRGQRLAVLELVDNVWFFTSLFGERDNNGLHILDTEEEARKSNKMHDEFVDFIIKIDVNNPNYWNQIFKKLQIID